MENSVTLYRQKSFISGIKVSLLFSFMNSSCGFSDTKHLIEMSLDSKFINFPVLISKNIVNKQCMQDYHRNNDDLID